MKKKIGKRIKEKLKNWKKKTFFKNQFEKEKQNQNKKLLRKSSKEKKQGKPA